MGLEQLSRQAKAKGLNLLGTGDFTHPAWFRELKAKLEPVEGSGLFRYGGIWWMLTAEVNTVYEERGRVRKVHHVIHVPSLDIAQQINERLSRWANLSTDGRPTLGVTSPQLVEMLIEIYRHTLIVPAHAWTSWFGVLGEFSGFDSLEECYHDQTRHIYALETGMSSDPEMNWRLSRLDKFVLMSNSDSHSPWTWRIGREANVFELKSATYWQIFDAVKNKDGEKFQFTIETPPAYGKYHHTGHRRCGVNLHPRDALRLNNLCPKCGRKLTIGVLQRVEQLADRPEGYTPERAIPFKTLLPLYEIISHVMGVGQLYSPRVIAEQDKLIRRFGSEFNVLLNASHEELIKVTHSKIASAILVVREGRLKYVCGYDGVYGKPIFDQAVQQELSSQLKNIKVWKQKSLAEFGPVV